MLREDLPWLYDLGQDLYRALRLKDTFQIHKESREFLSVLEVALHNPFFNEFLRAEDEETFYTLHHIPEIVERFVSRFIDEVSSFEGKATLAKMVKPRDGKSPREQP
jgi:hypothetical protein